MNVLIAPSIVNSIINARILEEQEKAIENPVRPDSAEDPDESFKKYTLINENYEIQVSRCVPRPNRDTSDTLQEPKPKPEWNPDTCIFKPYNYDERERIDQCFESDWSKIKLRNL